MMSAVWSSRMQPLPIRRPLPIRSPLPIRRSLSIRRPLPMRLPAFVLGLLLLAAPACAQEPTPGQLAAARELIALTGSLTSVDELLPTFGEQIKRQSVSRPELAGDLDVVLKTLQPELELQRQQITNLVARDYAKYMSEAEMREVITFFKSPAGSKYIKSQPALVDDIVNDVSAWSEQVSEYVVTRVRAEMAKRGHLMQ